MREPLVPKIHIMSPRSSASPRWEFSHVEHGSYDPLPRRPSKRFHRKTLFRWPNFELSSGKAGRVSRALAEMRLSEMDPDLGRAVETAKAGALALVPLAAIAGVIQAASRISVDPKFIEGAFHLLQQSPLHLSIILGPSALAFYINKKVDESRRPLREREGRLRVNSDW